MDTYEQGTDTAVTFELVDADGNALVPIALSLRVLDQDDMILVPSESVALPTNPDGTIEISIAAAENTIAMGSTLEMRVVELSVTTAKGSLLLTQEYFLRSPTPLTVLVNSFQTLNSARVRSAQMPALLNWDLASDDDKVTALLDAYIRLQRQGYNVRTFKNVDAQNTLDDIFDLYRISPRFWPVMTLDQFMTYYPEEFREALRKAQIAEANERLTINSVEERRARGILQETIGESTTIYRPGKGADYGLSRAALQYLTGFIDQRVTLTRS